MIAVKKSVIAGALGIALSGTASAADMPVKAPMLPLSPAFDWSGVYLGVHAGYGGGMKDWTGEGQHFPVRGFLGGAQIGINKQIASFVVGLEMEGSWANIGGSQAVTNGSMGPFFLGVSALSASSRIEAMATFAGRAGLAADRWFVFAKGGLAGAWEKHSLDYTNDFAFGGSVAESVRGSEFRIAPMIGFGAEYALDPHWSIKAEYDYLHFGSRTVALNGTATFNGTIDPAFRADEPVKQDAIHLVKIGANYRLGPVATDPAYRPVRAAQGTDWTGAFLGVQGGYGFGRMDRSTFIDPASSASAAHDLTGWLGGFAGGVNVQSGVLVFGVEGEWTWTGLRGGRTFTAPDHAFGGTVVTSLNSSMDWLAIASAKAGFVVGDRLLVYGKGGLAIASERHSAAGVETFPAPNPDVFTSATSGRAIHSGVAVGAGAEYALGGNWSIKGEYNYIRMIAQQHTDTGIAIINSVPPDQGIIAPGYDKVGQDLHLFKLGVNYHFSPLPGGVTARY